METAKEKCIREAYGDKYSEVKDHLDENGWLNWTFKGYFGDKGACTLAELESIVGSYPNHEQKIIDPKSRDIYYRPISLKGLEDNNGWISIEPDGSNLPKQWDKVHFIVKEFTEYDCSGHYDGKLFWNLDESYASEIVTHYQPIVKPSKPLY